VAFASSFAPAFASTAPRASGALARPRRPSPGRASAVGRGASAWRTGAGTRGIGISVGFAASRRIGGGGGGFSGFASFGGASFEGSSGLRGGSRRGADGMRGGSFGGSLRAMNGETPSGFEPRPFVVARGTGVMSGLLGGRGSGFVSGFGP